MNTKVENVVNKVSELMEPDMLHEENTALKAKLREMDAMVESLNKKCMFLESESERNYMRGRIDGLEFSIRCNGVSGDTVK